MLICVTRPRSHPEVSTLDGVASVNGSDPAKPLLCIQCICNFCSTFWYFWYLGTEVSGFSEFDFFREEIRSHRLWEISKNRCPPYKGFSGNQGILFGPQNHDYSILGSK